MKYWSIHSSLLNQFFGVQENQTSDRTAYFCAIHSNQIFAPEQTIFFGFKGQKTTGNTFAAQLYHEGVRMFILDASFPVELPPEALVWYVKSPLSALQLLAKEKRNQLSGEIIGITGSYGKTMVKQWIGDLARPHQSIYVSPGSYNSQIGVCLSVLQAPLDQEVYIFEAGISQIHEMDTLAELIRPTIGIFTSLGSAHLEQFDSKAQLLSEKWKLFHNTNSIIAHQNYFNQEHVCLPSVQNYFQLSHLNENLALVMECLACLGIQQDKVQIEQLSTVPNRLQVIEGANNNSIILDSHSADLESLQLLLDYLDRFQEQNIILILSEFEHFNRYDLVVERIQAKQIGLVITIGDNWEQVDMDIEHIHFKRKEECSNFLQKNQFKNACFALKGSRTYQLETFGKLLESKGHTTILEVSEEAIQKNIRAIRTLLDGTELTIMVKANAYGAGLVEVSKICIAEGVQGLGVAYLDEALELKQSGIHCPIMVIQPTPQELEECCTLGFEPEISSFQHLIQLIALANNSPNQEFNIHIKFDTGMNRLGFRLEDCKDVFSRILTCQNIQPISIVSHLSKADEPKSDAYSFQQISIFQKIQEISKLYFPKLKAQILNTSGILRFPEHQFDRVRTGIGILGLKPSNSRIKFECAIHLKAQIAQIRSIEQGEEVSYGGTFVAERTTTIAVLRIGYADGLPRQLSNSEYRVTFQNYQLPIIGNICMDMCMIDISTIQSEVTEGDYISIFNSYSDIQKIADIANTIDYDIVSRLGQRVKRIYSL